MACAAYNYGSNSLDTGSQCGLFGVGLAKGTQPSGWKYFDGNAGTDDITSVSKFDVAKDWDLKCHRKGRGA